MTKILKRKKNYLLIIFRSEMTTPQSQIPPSPIREEETEDNISPRYVR